MTQGSLLFQRRDRDAATRLQSDFYALLADGQWHRGKLLQRHLGTNERVIRQCADNSSGQVISSDKGYKLTMHASVLEIERAENRLRSQAMRMLRRVIQIRKVRASGGKAA
jgi:hypothetical protein